MPSLAWPRKTLSEVGAKGAPGFVTHVTFFGHFRCPSERLQGTFLSHDGVPWNNNNAEHAIKAFARLRRAIEGLSTLIWTFWIFSVQAKRTSSPSRKANRTDAGTLLSVNSNLEGAGSTAKRSGTEEPRRFFSHGGHSRRRRCESHAW